MIHFEAVYPDSAWPEYRTLADDAQQIKNLAFIAFKQVVEGTGKGSEWLGWRRILSYPNLEEVQEVKRRANWIREHSDTVVIAGIGGSYLGAKAILQALTNPFTKTNPEILFSGFHMGSKQTAQLLDYLKTPLNGQVRRVHVIVISKSGSTIETAISFRALRIVLKEMYGQGASEHITAITGPEGGKLNGMVEKEGYAKFIIPDDVGGRFSVLTPVGLLPLAVAGVEITTLLDGAVKAYSYYDNKPDTALEYASFRIACYKRGIALDIIGSFEPELNGFSSWIQQLMGESEGKDLKGIFPVGASYSTDLHSLGQIIQEGRRNLMETLLVLDKESANYTIPSDPEAGDDLEYLAGRTLFSVNQSALNGTVKAHSNGGVPVAMITLPELNESSLGAFIYFYELTTAIHCYLLDVNPFDQPGVEAYKLEMRTLLNDASYSS